MYAKKCWFINRYRENSLGKLEEKIVFLNTWKLFLTLISPMVISNGKIAAAS